MTSPQQDPRALLVEAKATLDAEPLTASARMLLRPLCDALEQALDDRDEAVEALLEAREWIPHSHSKADAFLARHPAPHGETK